MSKNSESRKDGLGSMFSSLRAKVDQVLGRPMSEEEYVLSVDSGTPPSTGVGTFSDREEFIEVLKYVQSQHSSISDEWVAETIEHEDEHLAEARRRLGDKGTYSYQLKAVQMKDGDLGILGAFDVKVIGMTKQELDENHRNDILNAPKKKSASDKRKLGIDPDADLLSKNGW